MWVGVRSWLLICYIFEGKIQLKKCCHTGIIIIIIFFDMKASLQLVCFFFFTLLCSA